MKIKVCTFAAILMLLNGMSLKLMAGAGDVDQNAAAPAFVEARFNNPGKLSRLKPGDTLQGEVTENVFFGDRLAVPKGSRVSMSVSRLERRPKGQSIVLPWPAGYFLPKYGKYPAFDYADITLPDGSRMRLHVTSASQVQEVHASLGTRSKRNSGEKKPTSKERAKQTAKSKRVAGPRYEVVVDQQPPEAPESSSARAAEAAWQRASQSEIKTVTAGTEAKLALLDSLTASKSRTGEPFRALLIEPLRLNSGLMLPEGTVFEGFVSKRTPARRLCRSGSLYLTFNHLVLPAGTRLPIAASISGVGVAPGSYMKVSSEGGLKGGSPGKARLLVELGVSFGLSKVADDTYQLIDEAFVSTATDASTAGTARLIGLGFAGFYWLTRRGRDVNLPPYTMLTVRFDRTPSLVASGVLP